MEKIVIADDSTLANMRVNFRHLLPGSEKIAAKLADFKPLESLTGHVPENFFPSALTSRSAEEALKTLHGDDELELFFMILLSEDAPRQQGDAPRHVSTDLLKKLKAAKDSISKENYLNLLIVLLIKFGKSDEVISEIEENLTEPDPVADLILSFYDEKPREIKETGTLEELCAAFIEAIKAERSGDHNKAFTLMLKVFKGSDLHKFIFEILKLYIMRYSGISPENIAEFTKTVTESPLPVSFTTVKFIEFCYYYKNNIEDKLEETVSILAENTDSVFIINIIAPLLYKYKKWDLVEKFYKLSSQKAVGAEKTMYLELLADIYENKLEIPDFAAEIYREIADEDPLNCTFALSKALSIYEDNGSWEKLADLYTIMAERETEPVFQAAFFSKTGEIFLRRLNDPEKAAEYFEKSLAAKYSFETARMLAGLCIGAKNYERCIEILTTELKNASEKEEKIRILNKLADCRTVQNNETEESEKYLLKILEIDPKNLDAVKKLGLLYGREKNWEKLTETNFKEIDLSRNIAEIAALYYKNGVVFYEEIKDLTRATECFRELLEIIPDHLPSLLYLERIYSKTKDAAGIDLAVSQILDLIGSSQSKTALSYQTILAMILRDRGKTKASCRTFSEILKNHPENLIAKENLRMLEGKADFANIETESIDYNECDFELFLDYVKHNDSSITTDEILKREESSFWKNIYFLYKEGKKDDSEISLDDKEQFIMSLFNKNFSVNIMIKNSNKKIALMFLVDEYIKTRFFDGISIILSYHLEFEPKIKQKIWSLFFRGCENPNLENDLEELLTTVKDKQSCDIIREILEHIYIKSKDFDTFLSVRNIALQKIEDNKEKCSFIDETIALSEGNISNDRFFDLYKKRINFTSDDDLGSFLNYPENLEHYIDMLLSEGKYEKADESIKKFITDPFDQTVFFSKTALRRNDREKENEILMPILFEALSKKAPYPLQRLLELNRANKRLSLFIAGSLLSIGEDPEIQKETFPNFFALEKEKVLEFAGFTERERLLGEFTTLLATIPSRTRITASPLHSNRHRKLVQLIEYIRLSCNFDELEGLWDEEGTVPVKAMIAQQTPCIIFSPVSLKSDFEELKSATLRAAFLLSFGLDSTSPETAEKIEPLFKLVGKDKVNLVKSVRSSLQRRMIELLKLLENTDISEIRSFLEKMDRAALWHAFYLDPDAALTKDDPKTEDFVKRYFL